MLHYHICSLTVQSIYSVHPRYSTNMSWHLRISWHCPAPSSFIPYSPAFPQHNLWLWRWLPKTVACQWGYSDQLHSFFALVPFVLPPFCHFSPLFLDTCLLFLYFVHLHIAFVLPTVPTSSDSSTYYSNMSIFLATKTSKRSSLIWHHPVTHILKVYSLWQFPFKSQTQNYCPPSSLLWILLFFLPLIHLQHPEVTQSLLTVARHLPLPSSLLLNQVGYKSHSYDLKRSISLMLWHTINDNHPTSCYHWSIIDL